MRVHLVEPAPAGHNVYDLSHLPRLGLPLMATMLSRAGHEAAVSCEVIRPVDLGRLLRADLVGISTTTATAPAAYLLADKLAEAGVPVVLGGPHVTFRPEKALSHAPYVVRGEGQDTMVALVSLLEEGGDLATVAGLSHRDAGGSSVHNPDRPRRSQQEFELLPNPDLSLIDGHERMRTKPVMTQWGCPFDCEFCSVSAQFSRRVRHRRPDQVVAELAGLGAERVFFFDDNFVVNKARTTELLRQMLAAGVALPFSAQMRAQAALRRPDRPEADDAFLAQLRQAGCQMTMLGIEAVSDAGMKEVDKRQSVATVVRAVEAFHRHGIAVHGMFVAGLDADDETSPRAAADFACSLGIDTFQLMVETPLPGTRLWERVVRDERLLTEDWSLFDGHHVVMRPAQMTPLTLQLAVLEAMRHFYSWPRILGSGIASALTHLPALLGAARPATARTLPALWRATRARHWEEVPALMRQALPEEPARRVADALWLPALRVYGRLQLQTWLQQESAHRHLSALRALEAA